MSLLLCVGLAQAEEFYVLVRNPREAVAQEAGGLAATVLGAAGVADKAVVTRSVEPVKAGFVDAGVEASLQLVRLDVVDPLACRAEVPVPPPFGALPGTPPSEWTVEDFTLVAGRYWLISVTTSGWRAWVGAATGWTDSRLFTSFRERGVDVALCRAAEAG